MVQVAIVGGGLSGLATAFRLRRLRPDVSLVVLEGRDRAGGNIGTENHGGFVVETGPNGFLDRTPSVPQLCRDLGLGDRLVAASEAARKNRFLFLNGKLTKMPGGPFGLLGSSLLSIRGKWKLFTEPWRRRRSGGPEESVAEFVTRRAGREAAEIFADALVTGIHAGDPKLLSVAAAFPRLPLFEAEAGSIIKGFMRAAKRRRADAAARGEPPPGPMRMWSFREGLQTMTDALAAQLGDSLQTSTRASTLTRNPDSRWTIGAEDGRTWSADAIVLASPAPEQAALLGAFDESLAAEIAAIRYNRIAVVALGYRKADCPITADGFGYIAPQNTRRDVLGVQWCSTIYPGRAPDGCVMWRALCGGMNRAEVADWPDDRLLRAVHEEMKLAMGVTGEPVFSRILRWPAAIPQYMIGHLDRVARIESAAARHPGLFLAGNAYHGVAMGDCVDRGEITAHAVDAFLNGLKR